MRIDFHLHTAERSGCAMSSAADQLAAAAAAGLDAVAVTDHHALSTAREREVWQERHAGLRVLPGIEITLDEEYEDILVIGLDEPELARGSWSWPDLRAFVRDRGGLTILAHPLRFMAEIGIDMEEEPPDAVEAWSSNIQAQQSRRIRSLAAFLKLPVVANSDAHWTGDVGRFANRLHEPALSLAEVLAAVREGRFTPEGPEA
jgi:hypothetical protein